MSQFKADIEEIYANNPQNKVDKAVAAMQLERAYEALENRSFKTELESVYAENAVIQ